MAVIAKMNVVCDPRAYGNDAQLVELQCVCDDKLFASDPSAENVSFNQASPNGDARITLSSSVNFRGQEELYLIFIRGAERPEFPNALVVEELRCVAITDYGGTSKRVEVCSAYRDYRQPTPERATKAFNMRITIDNPRASNYFDAGNGGYWVGVYRASEMTMTEALAFAHAA